MAEKHLSLLREEHVALQSRHAELQRRYDVLLAGVKLDALNHATDDAGDCRLDGSFVERLVDGVRMLFDKELYSRTISIADIDYTIGLTLLKWVYTDQLDSKLGDSFLLSLIKAAQRFKLQPLIARCQQLLISRLDASNCIQLYQIADEIGCNKLRDGCSQLITARWDEFTAEDFSSMSAPLLYKMLKSKSSFPLHSAIKLNREDVVFLYLIEFDGDELSTHLNAPDADGRLALSVALASSASAIATTLVSHGARVDAADVGRPPLLHAAVLDKRAPACRFLLAHDADLSLTDEHTGRTLLHALAVTPPAPKDADICDATSSVNGEGDVDCADVWLREVQDTVVAFGVGKAAFVNRKDDDGKTAVHLCIEFGNSCLLNKLLSLPDLDLNIPDNDGHVALRYALIKSDLKNAELLVNSGADVNTIRTNNRYSLLHDCVSNGLDESVAFLIQHSADLDALDSQSETPLHVCARASRSSCAALLLAAGCAPSAANAADADTPLHLAVTGSDGEEAALQMVRLMSTGGTTDLRQYVDQRNAKGETAFSAAVFAGRFKVAAELAEKAGADVNLQWTDKDEGKGTVTLLLRAIGVEDERAALFLLEHGASAAARTPAGLSALQLAVRRPMRALVRALCRAGADLNEMQPDADGRAVSPPLWVALANGNEDNASVLAS